MSKTRNSVAPAGLSAQYVIRLTFAHFLFSNFLSANSYIPPPDWLTGGPELQEDWEAGVPE